MIRGDILEAECKALWEALRIALPLLRLFPRPGVPAPSCSRSKLALKMPGEHHCPGAASVLPNPPVALTTVSNKVCRIEFYSVLNYNI